MMSSEVHFVKINDAITSVDGRAPPGQKKPTPCGVSRLPDEVHGFPAPIP